MKPKIFVVLMAVLFWVVVGCSHRDPTKARMERIEQMRNTGVQSWPYQEERFRVVETREVPQVSGMICAVLERQDGALFGAIVSPPRHIREGVEVKVVELVLSFSESALDRRVLVVSPPPEK